MNRKFWTRFAEGAVGVIQLLATKVAFAQSGNANSGGLTLPNPLGCNDFGCVVDKIIDIMFTVAIPLCTIMVLYGGFTLLTSSGDPEKTKTGRNTILYAAGGFAVVILAKGITGLIQGFFQ